MRYSVGGREVRTENAAKPIHRASTYLTNWLQQYPPVEIALDYGCGKLRYAVALATKCRRLILVDSEIQLAREQVIDGQVTTVRQYATRWARSRVVNVAEFQSSRVRVDFALCANVLSAVPTVRARVRVLRTIAAHLGPNARALLVVQYRNSHFSSWRSATHARRHGDGWLVDGQSGRASFYAPIGPEQLTEHALRAGMLPVDVWTRGESAFVLAEKER